MREQMRFIAYDVSKHFVRQVLAAPDSARFPEFRQDSEAISVKRDNGEYATAGWIEVGSGDAARRMPWRCLVEPMNLTSWKLNAIRVGDKTLHGTFPDEQ